MIKNGIDVVHWATKFLKPGKMPVKAIDEPLYALANFTQWNWPGTHGEDKFTTMFGGLRIEMAMRKTYGDYFEGSGWTMSRHKQVLPHRAPPTLFWRPRMSLEQGMLIGDCFGSGKAPARCFPTH